ncbi:SAM-dependent methyltransferase [Fructobacillus sp. W13]|uniref:SAM-dependent methyltransferase n=1 Tax=Fructobacillus apis TaxID=2935017 RepID=A0ABT0ZQC3_9LACO|nr:SAM-dependent methyltransferase [Fructobacillus apis]MCO0832196.1 SAM-dependent methyltransferase [Fructobacillus apis]
MAKTTTIEGVLAGLANRQLPSHDLPRVDYSADELMRHPEWLPFDEVMSDLRETMVNEHGIWFLPNQDFLADLKTHLKGRELVELCAGNAALSAGLQVIGVDAKPVDTLDWVGQDIEVPSPWTTVEKASADEAVREEIQLVQNGDKDALPVFLMAWVPNGNEVDWQILQDLRESGLPFELIVIGEENGATNSKKFWQNAEYSLPDGLNQNYHSFDSFKDAVYSAN